MDNAFFLFIAVIIKYYPQRVFRRQTGTKLTAAILQCAVVIAAAGKKLTVLNSHLSDSFFISLCIFTVFQLNTL